MVRSVMRTSQARERLLAAAVRHALDAGIADLSLRQLAAAIGTSHRMLIYHFGSREGLLVAVTRAVEEQQRAALLESGTTPQDALRSWEHFSDPALWPQERLFFELYAYALRGRPGTEGFLDGIVESWVAPIADALVKAGADEATARADARLGVAVVRGLLLDLLATGDRAGTTEAYQRFLARASTAAGPRPVSRSAPSGSPA
jgi:AcrR family transcriptional regulator